MDYLRHGSQGTVVIPARIGSEYGSQPTRRHSSFEPNMEIIFIYRVSELLPVFVQLQHVPIGCHPNPRQKNIIQNLIYESQRSTGPGHLYSQWIQSTCSLGTLKKTHDVAARCFRSKSHHKMVLYSLVSRPILNWFTTTCNYRYVYIYICRYIMITLY